MLEVEMRAVGRGKAWGGIYTQDASLDLRAPLLAIRDSLFLYLNITQYSTPLLNQDPNLRI